MRYPTPPWLTRGTLAVLVLITVGCASRTGFDREAMRAMLQPDSGTAVEPSSAGTPGTLPILAMPFKLALYFLQNDVPNRHGLRNIDWRSADKEELVRRLTALRDGRIVSDIFLLADPTIQGHDVRKVRQAAGRYGMDVVLIVERIGAVDRYNNGYAALYPTLVGAYFAPGTACDALVMIEGALWDVRSDRLYLTQAAEGASTAVGPAMSVEDRDILEKASREAFEKFGNGIADQLRSMKADRPRAPDRSR